MRAARRLLVCWACWACFLSPPLWAADLITVEPRWVVAMPDLFLRAAPGQDAAVLASVPYGAQLTLLSGPDPQPLTRVGSVPGRWVRVRWDTRSGWVFDAWLLSARPPPVHCDGYAQWAERWRPAGPLLVEMESHDGALRTSSRDYDGGQRLLQVEGQGPSSGELWLPGAQLVPVWFAARRCHRDLPQLRAASWPAAGHASLPSSGGAVLLRRQRQQISVSAPGAGTPLLQLRAEDEGVLLAWQDSAP